MNTIVLTKYPNHRIFEDAALVFMQQAGDDTLCFGTHEWTPDDISKARKQCQRKLIAYQSELLYTEGGRFRNSHYIHILQQFDEVWDYSEHNIPYLKSNGITKVKYVPVMPSALLKYPPVEHDIDILHVGSLTCRRRLYINALLSKGYDVYDVVTTYKKLVLGEEMHQLYCRSKVVWGLHSNTYNPIQESFRYQFPLSNGITVLAEKSLSNPLGLEEFSNIEELVALLQKYVKPKKHDDNWYLDNYVFTGIDEGDDMFDMIDTMQCMEFAECLLNDAKVLVQLRSAKRRQNAIEVENARLFRGMLYMLKIVMLNEVGFDASQRRAMYDKLKEVYASLYKPSLRKLLLSTGGHLWPRLRCAMQLSGWSILCTTMRLFLLFHAGDKYITRSIALHNEENDIRYKSHSTSIIM